MRTLAYSALCAALCAAPAIPAAAQTPITLDQAMSNPDWLGTPVETAWWSWDGKQVYYKQKRAGSPLRDTFQAGAGAGIPARKVADAELASLDSASVQYNRERTRALMVRSGDLFERDLKSGALTQISKGATPGPLDARYSADGRAVLYRVGHDWYSWNRAERLASPVALPRTAKDPAAAPDASASETALRDMQLRLIATLKRQKDDKDTLRERADAERLADATRAPLPVYLGDKVTIDASALSPDGRYLVLATSPKGDKGRVGKMPRYVTESGYEETDDERTRVGRDLPKGQTLKLVDLKTRTVQDIPLDALPGIATDPLAAMREERKLAALKGNRAVRLDDDESGGGIAWTGNGAQVAVMLRAVDNKDRWIAAIDLASAIPALKPLHRISDSAWVNGSYNEFGWLPDHATLWFLSEESGYAHLYTLGADGKQRALTQGNWEATRVHWSADGATAFVLCNRKTPGAYEVCAVNARDASVREATALDGGVEQYSVSPDERKLLVHYSSAYVPAQIATVAVAGGATARLTDTRTPDYKARSWIQPELVAVPSAHGGGPIWSKLYRPANLEPGRKYPVVMFVHGAGYLQNATRRFPVYFREQMFHNLLVQQGYIVLDMDYRASKGYGRDWRTAIYRQMGHPELDDYIDGVNWMVANHQGDAGKVGIYGGSYGGFMTFMALLRAPDMFKAGAALRPVTDWTTYNHEYTANILNTPELDPEAYRKSSPIEYADKLRGHLLIAHGMVDDNVFYQDSVRMAQRLIELKKDNWELASYPLERHAYLQPESWYDQYRRIYQLFERSLKR
ncbi:S9 family peptidase [Pseudoduganella sp. LjRoot289]|uniref:S9 family peptidase n=1 Tax=Pseudoduganella sp. LjRoot289 TaxID=3342314 RepID=UPI003ED16132